MVIAIVGKYTKLEDAYISVIKALRHAALLYHLKLCIKVTSPIYPYVHVIFDRASFRKVTGKPEYLFLNSTLVLVLEGLTNHFNR